MNKAFLIFQISVLVFTPVNATREPDSMPNSEIEIPIECEALDICKNPNRSDFADPHDIVTTHPLHFSSALEPEYEPPFPCAACATLACIVGTPSLALFSFSDAAYLTCSLKSSGACETVFAVVSGITGAIVLCSLVVGSCVCIFTAFDYCYKKSC